MSLPDESKMLEKAIELANLASEKILQILKTDFSTQRKEDNSPVTIADLEADQIIREGLLKSFPQHAILTEENGLIGNEKSEYTWLIDPLDGTKAFAKKIPGFCVMIGLLRSGVPHLGVVADPLDQSVFCALKGEQAYKLQGPFRKILNVSDRNEASEMPLVVSTGFPAKELEKIKAHFSCPVLDPINSVGIKVSYLVQKKADLYLNHHDVNLWDTCAPQIILEEAGGIFTKIDGNPLSYSELKAPYSHGAKTFASHGKKHQDWVEWLNESKLL